MSAALGHVVFLGVPMFMGVVLCLHGAIDTRGWLRGVYVAAAVLLVAMYAAGALSVAGGEG